MADRWPGCCSTWCGCRRSPNVAFDAQAVSEGPRTAGLVVVCWPTLDGGAGWWVTGWTTTIGQGSGSARGGSQHERDLEAVRARRRNGGDAAEVGWRDPTATTAVPSSSRRLSMIERAEISRGLKGCETFTTIAERIGRSPSTVSREVGEAGVAQLMAGAAIKPGPTSDSGDDLIEPFQGERSTTSGPFQHDEDPVGVDAGRPFIAEVVTDRCEEGVGDRHQPLMAALAVSDEHGSVGHPDVGQAQAEHFATAQPAEQQRQQPHRRCRPVRTASARRIRASRRRCRVGHSDTRWRRSVRRQLRAELADDAPVHLVTLELARANVRFVGPRPLAAGWVPTEREWSDIRHRPNRALVFAVSARASPEAVARCPNVEHPRIAASLPGCTSSGGSRSQSSGEAHSPVVQGSARRSVPLGQHGRTGAGVPLCRQGVHITATIGLVARDAELAAVMAELDRARSGGSRTVLIRGDAGSGKSRLLEELLAQGAGAGFTTVVGRAEDHDRRVAFAGLRLALHDRLTSETSPRLVDRAARLDALLFGVDATDTSETTPPGALDLLYEIVTGWADRRPLLLAIDDLHSADPETLEAFAFLARHLSGARVLLAGTVRSPLARLAPDVGAVIDRLRTTRSATIVDVGALRGPDLAALIRSELGDDPSAQLLEVVEDATGGNVFFTVELVRSLRDDGVITSRKGVADLPRSAEVAVPESAAIAVLHRVFRFGEAARVVARAVSAFSQLTLDDLALVGELTDLDRRDVDDAFDLLTRAGVLVPSGTGYRFAHPIVRSALYDDLGPAERRRLHERIAAELAARRHAGWSTDVVEVATHVRCCARPGDAEAAAILLAAGDAVANTAPRAAVEWYRDALDVLPAHTTAAGQVWLRLARALSLASRHDEAARAAADAMAVLPAGREWANAAALRLRALAYAGQAVAADRLFEELAALPVFHQPRILAQRAQLLDSLDRLDEAATAIAAAERSAGSADRVWVEIPRLHLAMSIGDWATGRRIADALRGDLPSLPLLARTSTTISLIFVHSHNGDPHVALDVADDLGDSPLLRSVAAGPIARALTRVGRWEDGVAMAADAVAEGGDRGLLYLAWLTIAGVAAERAQPPLDVEVMRGRLGDIELYATTALLCLAYLDVAEGRPERARSQLTVAWDHDRRSGRRNLLPWTLDLKAELDWHAGDTAAAIEASAALDALATDDSWLVTHLNALLTRAVVRADVDAAEQAQQLAADHLLPLELARANAAHGTLTRDADRLIEAYAQFATLGAVRRQRQVSSELRRLGRRVPRGVASTTALSAAERQLATLVGQGFTNREIAQRVHLSAKTIEAYLHRVFRKTGCSSRLELAVAVNNGRLELQ
jgi:DNA-binding CsgD family transcriptional regulator